MTRPLAGRPGLTLPSLALQYPRSLGVYDDYADAQRAVDYLSDNEFPVQNCMIVGTDLKQVERITGRLTYARAAIAGVASGAWMGLFIGLLLGLFADGSAFFGVIATCVGIGIAFGVITGIAGYAATGGRRDFTSVTQVVATRYEVLVEHTVAEQAREMLAKLPVGDPQL
ncbi:MAG: rane protein [Pseudonocardiales bacterium]|nr:rane protein [Pseudonocardiales bacterium]